MRVMEPPQATTDEVLAACVSAILNEGLKRRIEAVEADFRNGARNYYNAASNAGLYAFPANSQEDNDILLGAVTKGEVKSLYTYYLLKSKPGRVYYDALVASAPKGICPLCGVGVAATLDHYLPKAKFPLFSVLPYNLVPACRDCNTGKLAAFGATAMEQSLHPYFDHGMFISEQWLAAEVIHTSPTSIRFLVAPPAGWSDVDRRRVTSHFVSLKLAARYAILAAGEIASITGMINNYVSIGGPQGVRQFLNACALTEMGLHKNSWKTAMFFALAASDWFCEIGFKQA